MAVSGCRGLLYVVHGRIFFRARPLFFCPRGNMFAELQRGDMWYLLFHTLPPGTLGNSSIW